MSPFYNVYIGNRSNRQDLGKTIVTVFAGAATVVLSQFPAPCLLLSGKLGGLDAMIQ